MEAKIEQSAMPMDHLTTAHDLGGFGEGDLENRDGLAQDIHLDAHSTLKFDILQKEEEKCDTAYAATQDPAGVTGLPDHQEPEQQEQQQQQQQQDEAQETITQQPQLPPYGGDLTHEDVGRSLDEAKARLLNIIIRHFIVNHTVPVTEPQAVSGSTSPMDPAKAANLKKRKARETQYEGDPRYLLPLTFVTNLYETLVADCNARIANVPGLEGRSFGQALEAAGGLYRKLVEKYPKSGSPVTYKRREMASALEARVKFPMLVTEDEKRTRFIVIHGLEIVEKPETIPPDDGEWFKKVTGRHEAAVTAKDYMFFSARTKVRRPAQPREPLALPMMTMQPAGYYQKQMMMPPMRVMLPPIHVTGPPLGAPGHQPPPQPPPQLPPPLPPGASMSALVAQNPVGKYCDECGATYVRETSKFCSECGTSRPGS